MSAKCQQSSFVILSACKNEQDFVALCIESVLKQSILPSLWIIIDDGSTDNTPKILKEYADKNNFIKIHSFPPNENRSFGSKDKAINHAFSTLHILDYDYIGILDTDISLESINYFKTVTDEFKTESKLAITGGEVYENTSGTFKPRPVNVPWSVAGCVQMYRRECFLILGGFLTLDYGGSDTYSELRLREMGWHTKTIRSLQVNHYRPTSSASGILRGSFRAGLLAGSFGSHPIFMIVKMIRRIFYYPPIIGSTLLGFGYLYYRLFKRDVLIEKSTSRYLRQEQISRIKKLFKLKNSSISSWEV